MHRIVMILGTAFALACSAAPESEPVPVSPLEGAFEQAGAEYGVSPALLKAIGYVETRWRHRTEPSLDLGFGVMHLTDRAASGALARAAELTGLSREALVTDPAANIRGAAAVLRSIADRAFATYGDLDAGRLGDWFHPVMRYSGIPDAALAEDYAAQVFGVLETGAERRLPDGRLALAATPTEFRRHLLFGERKDALTPDYPQALWNPSPNYSSGHSAYNYVVIHVAQGSYAGTISWFKNTSSNVSSQYVVRSSDGQITQMVEERNTAWHAQCYNSLSVGIEHEGFVSDPAWFTDAMYNASAKLTRFICDAHGIPRDRTHIIGHNEVAPQCNTSGHTDPGSNWNWTRYMTLVNGTGGTANGTLTGVIYVSPDTANRIDAATVKVLGTSQSTVTGSNGLYTFSLPPGTYTVEASKSGYTTGQATRTVTAGTTIWGSIGLSTAAATGTLTGVIYVSPDTANRIDAAAVRVIGTSQSMVTGSNGVYTFSLAPGGYTVEASKSGYSTGQATRTVTAGTTMWGSIGLTASGTGTFQGAVYAVNPADPNDRTRVIAGATVSAAPGGQSATTAADGTYTLPVPPGSYTLTATRTGYQTATATGSVGAGATAALDLGLTPDAPDTTPPTITIRSPKDGAGIDVAQATVIGQVTDDRATIGSVEVSVGAAPASSAPVALDGSFAATVDLAPGANLVVVSANDGPNVSTARITIYFRSGIDGLVFVAGDAAKRIAGAAVEALDLSGNSAGKAASAADGTFAIDLPPGDHVLTAKAAGFLRHAETVTVGRATRTPVSLGLTQGEDLPARVVISSPPDGATTTESTLMVAGRVEGFLPLRVEVSGVPANVYESAFTATVTLVEGENLLTAVAVAGAGAQAEASVRVTRLVAEVDRTARGGCGCGAVGSAPALLSLAGLALVRGNRRRR